jgi:hypothetical protein
MNTTAIHAEAVEILVEKAHFEPAVALGIAEAIEVSINLTQVVTVPILDARLQELRHEIKSDFAEVRAEFAGEFERMRGETAIEFGRMRTEMANEFARQRADMADAIGKVRVDMAGEFAKVRVEIGEVRTEMAKGFGLVAGEFGKVRKEAEAIKADLMRWVLLTLISSAAITAAVTPLVKALAT